LAVCCTVHPLQVVDCCIMEDGTPVSTLSTLDYGGKCLRDEGIHTALFEDDGTLPGCLLQAAAAHSGVPIFECNSSSCCPPSCPQRSTQGAAAVDLVVGEAGSAGHGLFLAAPVPAGAFLGEYTGNLVSSRAAASTTAAQPVGAHSYHLTYTEHFTQKGKPREMHTCVDAARRGSLMRFINHSCAPNCVVMGVRTHNSVPRLCVFALRSLPHRAELTLDYGAGEGDGGGSSAAGQPAGKYVAVGQGSARQAQGAAPDALEAAGRVKCVCGSAACRGFVPFSRA